MHINMHISGCRLGEVKGVAHMGVTPNVNKGIYCPNDNPEALVAVYAFLKNKNEEEYNVMKSYGAKIVRPCPLNDKQWWDFEYSFNGERI
jgi:hypothetical protein